MQLDDAAHEPVIDALLSASRVLATIAAHSLNEMADPVTLTQYRTLDVLVSRGPQNLAGLALSVGVTPATATRMCDRLVKKHLIVRSEQEGDRRHIRLAATAKGRHLVVTVTEHRRQEIEKIVDAIGTDEQVALVRSLRRFTSAAEVIARSDGPPEGGL